MAKAWNSFECSVPGKWVLAGEHAVLRGATAIALPHPSAQLRLHFEPMGARLVVEPASAQSLIEEMLHSIRESTERAFELPFGNLRLDSTIPVGAGLGSSAALCVALTRWVAPALDLPQRDWFEFARRLEHRFHGRSSGMDVAATSSGEPISFSMEKGPQSIGVKRLPKFTFHDTHERCRTNECILRVEKYREENPIEAAQTDEIMATAGRIGIEGLVQFDAGQNEAGMSRIAEAMTQAQECYYRWRLMSPAAKAIEDQLKRDGARAVKLTGAGGGGFLVALWD